MHRKWMVWPTMTEATCLCDEFDDGEELWPIPKPAIEQDEYAFIDWSLQRWHDRAFARHLDPWRKERSSVKVWT